jgi:hypothetical protein
MDYAIRSLQRKLILLVALVLAGCAMEVSDEATEEERAGESPPDDDVTGTEQALTSADYAWWRGLSQIERNQAILDRAYRDLDRNVGVQCKPWVQWVVSEASRGVATVPLTAPNAYGWYWQPGRYATRVYTNIRNVRPGWIVQMNLRFANGSVGPHTAIVVGVASSGVYWVESNYAVPNTVKLRFQSYADFERLTYISGQYRYSVYYINGG